MFSSVLLGSIVGSFAALRGAGGGVLAVPLLVFGLDLSLIQAAPIGLMATCSSAALGAVLAHRHGLVRYKAATLMAAAGIALTLMGVWAASRVPTNPLSLLFALVLAHVGYRTFVKASRGAAGSGSTRGDPYLSPVSSMVPWAVLFGPCPVREYLPAGVWWLAC
jgi:uncharacterized membrane protein YfcA